MGRPGLAATNEIHMAPGKKYHVATHLRWGLLKNSKQEKWEIILGQFPIGTYIVKYITTENEWVAERFVVVR